MERKAAKDAKDFFLELQQAYETATRTSVPDAINAASHRLIGAAIEVHRCLGPGYPEIAYEEAIIIELADRGVSFERQRSLPLAYKGRPVWTGRIDLIVEGLVVELKAVESVSALHLAQLHSYLKLSSCPLGILINFNVPLLKDGIHRVIRKPEP
jgi:GxxExxY protein